MANKYTRKGKEKPVLPPEDEFVSFWEHAFKAVEPHLRNIAIGTGVLVGTLVVAWIVLYFVRGSREDATAMFARATRIHDAELLPADDKDKDKKPDAKAEAKPEVKDDKKSDDEETVPRFKTSKERAEATLAALDKLEKSHGSANVTAQAKLFRAGVLYELARFDEAKKIAEAFAGGAAKGNPLVPLAREDAGLVLESQGKHDEAIALYKDLAEKGPDWFRDRAMLDQARATAKKGDTAGAKDLYKKILEKMQAGPLHDEAQSRLALLGG